MLLRYGSFLLIDHACSADLVAFKRYLFLGIQHKVFLGHFRTFHFYYHKIVTEMGQGWGYPIPTPVLTSSSPYISYDPF